MTSENSLERKIDALAGAVEKGFAAIAEDIGEIKQQQIEAKEQLSGQIFSLRTQVDSIERHFRETKVERRLLDLEEHAFGRSRA